VSERISELTNPTQSPVSHTVPDIQRTVLDIDKGVRAPERTVASPCIVAAYQTPVLGATMSWLVPVIIAD